MAARVVQQIRVLCRTRNVCFLKSSSSSKLHCHRSLSSVAGTLWIKSNTKLQCPARLPHVLMSGEFQTDPSSQNKEELEETQSPSPDHPLPNIEDPFKEPVEPCILCRNKVPLSYKNVQLLSQFISPNTGRLYGRHITKLCDYQQKRVSKAVKRARQMGFMPFMYRETIFLKDPNLFDIRYTGNVDIAIQEPSNLSQPETQDEGDKSIDHK